MAEWPKKKLSLGFSVKMFQNFREFSLKMYFKQFLWIFRNIKWSPYMCLKERLSTVAFGEPTKSPSGIK